ncbi:MAG: hypothetical protein ACRCZB_04260 [Bacteroidales bacterium]
MGTVEEKTARSILQTPKEIHIGDAIYQVAPPSVATLILASEAISRLPNIQLNSENPIAESLYIAKDCAILGDVMAILILGAKGLTTETTMQKSKLFGLIKEEEIVTVDNKALLAKKILEDISPRELSKLLDNVLSGMEVGFFFGISTSLIEINLLRTTRSETTVFGL